MCFLFSFQVFTKDSNVYNKTMKKTFCLVIVLCHHTQNASIFVVVIVLNSIPCT